MAAVSDSRASVPYLIDENSASSKIASSIPIVGCFVSWLAKDGLTEKIKQLRPVGTQSFPSENIPKVVELLKVRKDYLVADLVRDVLSLAFIVSLVAMSFFTGFLPSLLGGLCAVSVIGDVILVEKYHRTIKHFEALLEQSACQA